MEKLRSSMPAKTAAVILVILCTALFIGSFAGMLAIDSAGGYQMEKSEMLQKGFERACENYSIMALAGYQDDFNEKKLSATNFRYGIIKADSVDDVDLQDPDSYIAGNFEEIPDTDSLHLEECDLEENGSTQFHIGDGSILDSYYLHYQNPEYYTEEEYPVQEYIYDHSENIFYVRSGKKLFPVTDGVIYLNEGDMRPLDEAKKYITDTGDSGYQFLECQSVRFDDGTEVSVEDILPADRKELENYTVTSDTVRYFDEENLYVTQVHTVEFQHYIVASYVNQPLEGENTFRGGDMFIQMSLLADFAYRMRYAVIVMLVLSLVLLLGSFAFLMASAGHRRGKDGISLGLLDRVPLDLYFAGACAAESLFSCIIAVGAHSAHLWSSGSSFAGFVTFLVVTVCAGSAGILVFLAYCMSFAVRIKLGKWWRHTVIYKIWKKCMNLLSGTVHFCVFMIAALLKSITLLWKAWLLLGILAFLEFAAIINSYADGGLLLFWMLEKMILYPFLIIQLLQLNKLQKGAQRIADGAMDYQIDTRYMFWEVKKHGEYLNDIGNGINSAVNERMKSEHFKTELITNVSHDIKTPLTSIINYVDLLQKEEIENPTVQEYLEVLHRQSARLKKLIEDLMEASKASTGSLNVIMEKCEAGVMLVQTVGEFEEKLMKNQIELQIKKPEADIFIQADNRHLWRVFDNLMNNICKYAQPMTRAYVNLEQQGQLAVVTFRNISKYQLNISSEELMERFVRGDSSRNTEGSGLGISIAKSLTELMNGTFELIVDGDLFKVILAFPLYGTVQIHEKQEIGKLEAKKEAEPKRELRVLNGFATGIQNAGAQAAGLGQNVVNKTGRMFRRAGRFAYHVRQAAEQVKAEEAEWETMHEPDSAETGETVHVSDSRKTVEMMYAPDSVEEEKAVDSAGWTDTEYLNRGQKQGRI